MKLRALAATTLVASAVSSFGLLGSFDFGTFVEALLRSFAFAQFGVLAPIDASSQDSITAAQALADPTALAKLAPGLRARVVTNSASAGLNIDQIGLWPNDAKPTHLIFCNEQGTTDPGLQRVRLSDGAVETIVTGTTECDPVRVTPWGTVLFGEEAGGGPNGGRMYELIHPLETTGVALDRSTGAFSGGVGAENLAVRPSLGRLSFEGLAVYASGLVYFADENRPGTGTPGGAYFKFVPDHPLAGGAPIAQLADSPLVSGAIYGLRLGKRSGNTDYGQGTELGLGTWIPIPPASDPDLRAQAAALKLTGYYRPEDFDVDRAAEADGSVRFCAANTGNEGNDHLWGNAICVTDGALADALANTATPDVSLLVSGTPQLAMMDNVAYQPKRGNWILHEDGDQLQGNNDLWDCLDDGADADELSDGCVRIATLRDLNAEWTGGVFDASGRRFFVSVQHNVSGRGVILEITGWR